MAWSRLIDRHRWLAATLGVVALLALAAPYLDVRYGFPDAGNNQESTQTRQAYDMLADGFGPGMNGPLLLVDRAARRHRRGGARAGHRRGGRHQGRRRRHRPGRSTRPVTPR